MTRLQKAITESHRMLDHHDQPSVDVVLDRSVADKLIDFLGRKLRHPYDHGQIQTPSGWKAIVYIYDMARAEVQKILDQLHIEPERVSG